MSFDCKECDGTGWITKMWSDFQCPECKKSGDPTRIEIAFDPNVRRMRGIATHGRTPFDVPFVSEVLPGLWQGGCENGLVLPKDIDHVVSLYPWERYSIVRGKNDKEVQSELYFKMYDSLDQSMDQVEELAEYVNERRKTGTLLVSCQAGLNRSSLVVARALMLDGMRADAAIALIREKRSPACLCNRSFLEYLTSLDD